MQKIEKKRTYVMKKQCYLSFILILLLCFSTMISEQIAKAASAIVSLDTGENEVLKGQTFSLLVSIDSAEEIGNVEMIVVFDTSKVTLVSGGKYTSGGDGIVLISDKNGTSVSTRKKYTLEFKAKEEGNCKFYVGDEPTISLASGQELMSVSSISLEIQVLSDEMKETQKEERKEENVTNKTNEVNETQTEEKEKNPENSTTVNSNEENKGALKIRELENRIKQLESELEFQSIENQNNRPEIGIHSTKTEKEIQITQYTAFTILDLEDKAKIPQGYIETSIRIDAHSITAYMKKDDMESKTYLLYGMDENGTANFYEYNRMNDTLKKYTPDYGGTTMKGKSEVVSANFQMMTAIIVLSILCAGLSVILALQLLKEKQRKEYMQEELRDFFNDK